MTRRNTLWAGHGAWTGSFGVDTQKQIEVLEAALAEYIARCGFTEQARAAMFRSTFPPCSKGGAEPVHGGDGDEDRPQAGSLPQS